MIHPPGPRGREVLGFFGRGRFPHTLAFLQDAARKYGPLTYFRLLHQPTFLVTGPELIKEVLIVQQRSFSRDFGAVILRELVGDGVITREEPLHRERRRVLQPAFHRDQIASYVTVMASEATATAEEWMRQTSGGLTVDIGMAMRTTTLSVIGRLLFGDEFRSSAKEISDILDRVVKRARRIAPFAMTLKIVTRRYRQLLPRGPSLYFREHRASLDRILQPMIQHRRKQSGGDVLSLLLALHDDASGSLSSEDIRNEMVTFVLAGHETTANALTWTFYLLAKHTDFQKRAAKEIEQVCGDRLPQANDLAALPFTTAVFQETLRLYPPVPLFGRRVVEAATLGGYEVPRGATVLLSPYITQRNEQSFPNAEAFDPARWLDPPAAERFAFFPFGGGAKMCIGDVFAKTEGVVILASLLQKFSFSFSSDPAVEIDPGVTLKPKNPILLRVEMSESFLASGPLRDDSHQENN
jgi:cytochrome P450